MSDLKINDEFYYSIWQQVWRLVNLKEGGIIQLEVIFDPLSDNSGYRMVQIDEPTFRLMMQQNYIVKRLTGCKHDWVDTGTKLVYCKKCNADGDLQDLLKFKYERSKSII